jgi:hypothetical protein
MKLRIKGNSLRLRVSRSELTTLLSGNHLEETIHFAPEDGAAFTYALQKDPAVATPTVRYAKNRVTVLLPSSQADVWGATNQVGITEEICWADCGSLVLLIEKDFACLDRSDEDNQDTFDNPNAGARC